MQPLRTDAGKAVASRISEAADWPILAGAAAILFVAASLASRQRPARMLALMLAASCIGGVLSNGAKSLFGRTRPNNKEAPQGFYGPVRDGQLLIGRNKFNSFPSSHTACAFAFFGPLVAAGPIPAAVGFAAAAITGFSRIWLGVHHFSDVVSGAAVGIFAAWLAFRHRTRIERWADGAAAWIRTRRRF